MESVDTRVKTIINENTGVCYAITNKGGITPMYNPDGSLLVVDQNAQE